MLTPVQKYRLDLKNNSLQPDAAQEKAVEHTQRLFDELLETTNNPPSFFKRILKGNKNTIKGLYFWGGVGRGKTYIIDSFYECLPMERKRRVHFSSFFKGIHETLGQLPKSPDPLKVVAGQIANSTQVLCIDEFHVDDITDAMIIAGLLDALFQHGVVLVTTSNIPVEDLYKNGLQRERFLPAIDLLQRHTDIVEIEAGTDYRKVLLEKYGLYHLADDEIEKRLDDEFMHLAPEHIERNKQIVINKRPIEVKAISDDVAWFDFDQLCNTPRSSSDYIDLARNFHTLVLNTLPCMSDGNNDIAQRFIQLIDALYDHQVKLIIGAESAPEELYTGNALVFPFQRIVSRLHEMRSEEYLSSAHKTQGNL